jgi:hypothetical protein
MARSRSEQAAHVKARCFQIDRERRDADLIRNFAVAVTSAGLPADTNLNTLLEHHRVIAVSLVVAALQAERPYDPNKLNVWMND